MNHNLRLVTRNLTRNSFYSLSIILGFSIALTVCWLLVTYLAQEFNADRFHEKFTNIYRVLMEDPITLDQSYITFHELENKLQTDYPEIDAVTKVVYPGQTYLKTNKNGDLFRERKVLYADSALFQVFDFRLIHGNRKSVLRHPFSAVLSVSVSRKYFGDKNPVGEIIFLKGQAYKVEGLVEDTPPNSHLQFDILLSRSSLPEPTKPLQGGGITYILLNPKNNPIALQEKLNREPRELISWNKDKAALFYLQELGSCYYSKVEMFHSDILVGRDKNVLISLCILIGIIFSIASFNLINFFQAKALFKSKQISTLRILGASGTDILAQFILEAFILCVVSLIVSFVIILLVLPGINKALDTTLLLHSIGRPSIVALMLGGIVLTSLLLGCIAKLFYVKSHNISLMGRTVAIGGNTINVLNGLVVLQLTVSLILCIVTTVIYTQLNFIRSKSLGFYAEGILEVNLMELPKNVNPASIKTEFLRNAQVLSASAAWVFL
jgi:putative ABC transport system permease protein